MNVETGEIKEEAKLTEKEKSSGEWKSLTIGDVADIWGVPCKLVNVNGGRRRLTFMPLGTLTRVPRPTSDPVVSVEHRGKRR